MHNEVSNEQSLDKTVEDSAKTIDKNLHNGNNGSISASVSTQQNGDSINGINNGENETVAANGDSSASWKASSRRCSSDGAIKISQVNGVPKPERGHSFSDSDEKTAALKAKIHQKYDELDKEMAAKACANGLRLTEISPPSEAVLQLGDRTVTLLSPDPR